uniref:Putative secreted peptide n=1 Tax=Anopheles braziliensis TaxID=58242 RepID=A0A2M3ZVV8_9DIPT
MKMALRISHTTFCPASLYSLVSCCCTTSGRVHRTVAMDSDRSAGDADYGCPSLPPEKNVGIAATHDGNGRRSGEAS